MKHLVSYSLLYACILGGVVLSAAPVMAQEVAMRPVMSEAYTVSDVMAALAEGTARSEAADAEQMVRYSQHEGGIDTFVRSDPILQQVTWPYGPCTDKVSLMPPPMPGWGLRSETLVNGTSPTAGAQLEVSYVTYDLSSGLRGADVFATEQSVTIRISDDAAAAGAIAQFMSDPLMRESVLIKGPYGYPVMPFGNNTLLGTSGVDVTGTGVENAAAYFTQIVGCAIESGLLADGIDPAELSEIP